MLLFRRWTDPFSQATQLLPNVLNKPAATVIVRSHNAYDILAICFVIFLVDCVVR